MGIGLDRVDQLRGEGRHRNCVLGLGPVYDALGCVPLIYVEPRDLFYALAGEHENTNCARIRWVHRCVGTLEPSIEAHKLFLIKPSRADPLRLSRYARSGIVDEAESSRFRAPVIMLRFHSPTEGRVDVTTYMVGH